MMRSELIKLLIDASEEDIQVTVFDDGDGFNLQILRVEELWGQLTEENGETVPVITIVTE